MCLSKSIAVDINGMYAWHGGNVFVYFLYSYKTYIYVSTLLHRYLRCLLAELQEKVRIFMKYMCVVKECYMLRPVGRIIHYTRRRYQMACHRCVPGEIGSKIKHLPNGTANKWDVFKGREGNSKQCLADGQQMSTHSFANDIPTLSKIRKNS